MDWSTTVPSLIGAAGATTAGLLVASRQARIGRSNRRHDAYADVLRFSQRALYWAERTKPMLGFSGEPPPPAPTVEEQIDARTLMILFGTDTVRKSFFVMMENLIEFTRVVQEMNLTDAENPLGRRAPGDRNLWREVHEARKALTVSFDAMAKLMSEEVASTPRTSRVTNRIKRR